MRSPLAWLSLGAVAGVWSWLLFPLPPLMIGALGAAVLSLMRRLSAGPCIVALGLCVGQALVWSQPPPGQLRQWTTGEVQTVSGRSALLLTPEGHVWTQLWPSPPSVGQRVAGRLRPQAQPQDLPGAWPRSAQARLARAQSVRMSRWTTLSTANPTTSLPADLSNPGLLRALATGDRSGVPAYTRDLLRRTGTVHLLAISGLHVGMVSMMAGLLVWLMSRSLTRGPWPPLARALPLVAAVVAALSYGSLVNWPVSTQRATAMVTGTSLVVLFGRQPSPWQVLGFAGLVVLSVQPSQAASLGFTMSFGAVAALLAGMPTLSRLIPDSAPWIIRSTINSVCATVLATLGTLPITAWVFQSLPLGGPMANLVAVPLFAGLAVPAAILAVQGPEWLQPLCTEVADQAISLALIWIELCDAGTLSPAVGPAGALALIAAIAALSKPRWSALILLLTLTPATPASSGLTVTFPAIGQGSSALIRWPDGRHWLIDGGPPGQHLLHWLRRAGVSRLERVILSHPDQDHFGGLLPIIDELPIDQFWASRPPVDGEARYRQLWLRAHAKHIHTRTPGVSSTDPSTDNDRGLVLTLRHGRHRFLFLGDLSEDVESMLANAMPGMSVVQVAHHGSKTSSSPDLIRAANPKFALIQSGVDNRYGHPHPQTISRWSGTNVLRTDTLGSVRFRSDGLRLTAQIWEPLIGWRSLADRIPELH